MIILEQKTETNLEKSDEAKRQEEEQEAFSFLKK